MALPMFGILSSFSGNARSVDKDTLEGSRSFLLANLELLRSLSFHMRFIAQLLSLELLLGSGAPNSSLLLSL